MLGVVGHRDRVVDQQQWPAVFRTDEDAQQLFVEHGRRLADAEVDARILALVRRDPGWLHRSHAGRRLAAAEVVPGLLLTRVRVLHLSLQLALVYQRFLQRLDERSLVGSVVKAIRDGFPVLIRMFEALGSTFQY